METYSTLSSIFTVISFVVFLGIVHWAWSSRRKSSFAAAAVEPFALPDEGTLRQPTSSMVPLSAKARKGARR